MFKFLRSNAKFFYWIIAATFIAFIFVAWGMDVAGSRGVRQGNDAIGSVDGMPISADAYERTVREIQASMRQSASDRGLTSNQVAQAREQAWEQLVAERLMAAAVAERGLAVTDDEIIRIFEETPPPEILRAFVNEEGQVDMQAYYAALGDPNAGINWAQAEQWARQAIPREKLMQMVTAGIAVSDQEIRDFYELQTGRAVAEYMGVPLTEVTVDEPVDDAVIEAHYEANPGLYRAPALGRARVVAWEFAPSTRDHNEVRDLALDLKASIESGEKTFEEIAEVYSEDGTASQGGDLGTFDRNRMVQPFTEVAFSLPVGEISDPVRTQFGYHLIEVLDQEEEDGEVARVHARHILLRVEPSQATRDEIIEQAGEFRDEASSGDFVALADRDTTAQVLAPDAFAEGRDIPGLPQSSAGSRFVFRAEPGQVSPLLYTDTHVYVVMAEGVETAGPRPLEEVRGQVVAAIQRERQESAARERLSPAVGRVQMGETMADVAEELGLAHAVTDTIGINANIPDVGYATAFNTVALEAEVGGLVPAVATDRGVFALRVLWRKPFDEEDWSARREQLRQALLQQKRTLAIQTWLEDRKADAEIEDWRDEAMARM